MKSLRLLLALAVAGAFTFTAAHAGDDKAKAACTMDCKADKDGKLACSKDGGKTCCCGAEVQPASAKDMKKKDKKGKKEKKAKKEGKEEHKH